VSDLLKSCENRLAAVPHEAISGGAKVDVKQRLYSRQQSKHSGARHRSTSLEHGFCSKHENNHEDRESRNIFF